MDEIFEASEATLLELEERIAAKATGLFTDAYKKLLATLIALWPGDDAPATEKEAVLTRLNLPLLLEPVTQAEAVVAEGVSSAYALGIAAGLAQLGFADLTPGTSFKRSLPDWVGDSVTRLRAVADERVTRATTVLAGADSLDQAIAAVGLASPAPAVERVARTTVNRASNDGLTEVGNSNDEIITIWKAERDGCVRCLAYQGYEQKEGAYPSGLTFGKPISDPDLVTSPPLHPNCRCTQWLIHKDAAKDVQDALKREAKRSVLRGWSLPTETNSVRIDAARRLLAKNPAMPKSVQAYARSSVNKGYFARGRDFPG